MAMNISAQRELQAPTQPAPAAWNLNFLNSRVNNTALTILASITAVFSFLILTAPFPELVLGAILLLGVAAQATAAAILALALYILGKTAYQAARA